MGDKTPEEKACPILLGAKMAAAVDLEMAMVQGVECIKGRCEWYYHGCPAHIMDPKILKQIEKKHARTSD